MKRFFDPDRPSSEFPSLVDELKRLNDNFERYLDHLRVPMRGSKQEIDQSPSKSLYVGEPMSELEMAIKEHALATGHEWPPKADE